MLNQSAEIKARTSFVVLYNCSSWAVQPATMDELRELIQTQFAQQAMNRASGMMYSAKESKILYHK